MDKLYKVQHNYVLEKGKAWDAVWDCKFVWAESETEAIEKFNSALNPPGGGYQLTDSKIVAEITTDFRLIVEHAENAPYDNLRELSRQIRELEYKLTKEMEAIQSIKDWTV